MSPKDVIIAKPRLVKLLSNYLHVQFVCNYVYMHQTKGGSFMLFAAYALVSLFFSRSISPEQLVPGFALLFQCSLSCMMHIFCGGLQHFDDLFLNTSETFVISGRHPSYTKYYRNSRFQVYSYTKKPYIVEL